MAVNFIDGPAKGVRLSLARLPHFLRVVRNGDKWDALDQPDDEPAANEALFVYVFNSDDGGAFIDGRDPKTGKRFGRYENFATYRFHPTQPTDAEMRTKEAWTDWCFRQPEAARFDEKGERKPMAGVEA